MSVWQPKRRYDALYCHEDVPECIGKFVSEKYITKIIIGQPPVKDFQDIKELKKAAAKILNQIKNPLRQ